jgi:alpha-tubulin suppressor-like RCC1 family protein
MRIALAAVTVGAGFASAVACGFDVTILETRATEADGSTDASFDASPQEVRADAVVAGDYFTVALANARAYAWGAIFSADAGHVQYGPARLPTNRDFVHVCAGAQGACAVERSTGSVYCWGVNDRGQLGAGDRISSDDPRRVSLPSTPTTMACGHGHVCAILGDRSLWCWGDDFESQLGDPSTSEGFAAVPRQTGTFHDWIDISAGQGHTCGIRAPGTLWCWGRNQVGQLGSGLDTGFVQIRTPRQAGQDQDWVHLEASQDVACAIKRDGSLWCWGDLGALSLGGVPTRIGAANDWHDISLNCFGACGLRGIGEVWCLGRNDEGQFGMGENAPILVTAPTRIALDITPDGLWSSVTAGRFHTCLTSANGEIWCTGKNDSGQVGIAPSTDFVRTFTRIPLTP